MQLLALAGRPLLLQEACRGTLCYAAITVFNAQRLQCKDTP